MKLWRLIPIVLMLMLAAGAMWIGVDSDGEPVEAQQNIGWQVETDIWKDDLAEFLSNLDPSCDIEIESQGVVAYVVAYRCPDE